MAAQQVNKPKIKEKEKPFYVVNIKLLSNERRNDTGYAEIFKDIYKNKVKVPVRGGKHIILRTQFEKTVNDKLVIHGKISKFNILEGNDWINISNMEVETYSIPKDKFPNLKETEYYFIPAAHRLCIPHNYNISIQAIQDFFEKALVSVLKPGEQHQVIVEQSHDVFKDIKEAKAIKRLYIKVSYSNNDFNKEAGKFMDSQLKMANASEMEISIKPDNTHSVSLDSKVVNGALELAQSNGRAEATIVDMHDRTRKVITSKHPRTIRIPLTDENSYFKEIYNKIMGIFRSDADRK